jgi:hypothetical protein
MKGLIFGSLSMLMIVIASPLNANATTPINLVHLARNGYFQEQGIPSHMSLTRGIEQGQVKGKDVVKAAIEANRIPAELLNDASYVNSVDQQLDFLIES